MGMGVGLWVVGVECEWVVGGGSVGVWECSVGVWEPECGEWESPGEWGSGGSGGVGGGEEGRSGEYSGES